MAGDNQVSVAGCKLETSLSGLVFLKESKRGTSVLIPKLDAATTAMRSSGPRPSESVERSGDWKHFASILDPPAVAPDQQATEGLMNHKTLPNGAEAKLTELLFAQALRTILPKPQGDDISTASETWRGMLADVVAEKVADAMPAVVQLKASARPEDRSP